MTILKKLQASTITPGRNSFPKMPMMNCSHFNLYILV
jgi:hypothetical protein